LALQEKEKTTPFTRKLNDPSQEVTTPTIEVTTRSAAWPCPRCGGAMIVIERLTAYQIYGRAIAEGIRLDSS
jgi:predicted RNA-binding Zn-ribbon protein involved in translation (DUF1610 family)